MSVLTGGLGNVRRYNSKQYQCMTMNTLNSSYKRKQHFKLVESRSQVKMTA